MKKTTPEHLRQAIEDKLGWGPAGGWTYYDLEKISQEIFRATEISLSISTLKRFFGKVSYGGTPSSTTLNTLSRYVGYQDWRDFEARFVSEKEEIKPGFAQKEPAKTRLPVYVMTGLLLVLLMADTLFIKNRPQYNPDDFTFSSRSMLTSGLPNSVVFDYDASHISDEDTAFISQSWDVKRKYSIDKKARHHSAIYYYPGYFRAKLMAGKHILKEHDVQIITDGWLCLLTAPWGEKPLYFTKEETVTDNRVEVSRSVLERYGISLYPDLPELRIYNQQDLKGFSTENFVFETEVKSGFAEGKGACQSVEILIHAKNDILRVQLTRPACVGNLHLSAFGSGFASESEDLSGFGCDLDNWVKVRVECQDRHIRFFVNKHHAFETDITHPSSEIVGVQFRFEGPGAVQHTYLKSGNKNCFF